MKELKVPISLQGESRKGRPKYAGRLEDGTVVVYYGAEILREPIRLTLVPLEYLLVRDRNRNRKK